MDKVVAFNKENIYASGFFLNIVNCQHCQTSRTCLASTDADTEQGTVATEQQSGVWRHGTL